jgi:hypothetical protein
MNTRSSALRPTLAFAAMVAATLVMFRVLDIAITRLGQLPAAAYRESFFLDNLIGRSWRLLSTRVPWWLAIAGIAMLVVAVVLIERRFGPAGRRRFGRLFAGWAEVDDGRSLRWLVVAVTAVPAWALSCYARNLYLDQSHVADRLIVVALWIAIAWRPLFVLPFALAATAMAGQFVVPLGFISWTEMGVLLRFPILFGAFWIVCTAAHRRHSDVFIFGWCCLLAVTYWTSGLGKLRVGWLTHPHVDLLLLGAYANGWLSFLEPTVVERAARIVASFAWPLMLFTLLVECGSLVMLWRRWSLVGFLIVATAFHLGAFAMTGIFFWKWILVEAMLLVYLLRGDRVTRLSIFTPGAFALSVLAILASSLWAPSENLTWFDTPLTYSLELEAVDARGTSHTLPAGFFRPYGDAIVLGVAGAGSPYPKLTLAMGVTMDRSLADTLEVARSADAVLAIENMRGTIRVDSAASAALDDFVRTYAANARCASERDPLFLRIAGVPRHLWTHPVDAALPCGVAIERVRVFERTTFFDGTALRVVRRLLLREVPTTAPRVAQPGKRRPRAAGG